MRAQTTEPSTALESNHRVSTHHGEGKRGAGERAKLLLEADSSVCATGGCRGSTRNNDHSAVQHGEFIEVVMNSTR